MLTLTNLQGCINVASLIFPAIVILKIEVGETREITNKQIVMIMFRHDQK